jgi:hypothetical protein
VLYTQVRAGGLLTLISCGVVPLVPHLATVAATVTVAYVLTHTCLCFAGAWRYLEHQPLDRWRGQLSGVLKGKGARIANPSKHRPVDLPPAARTEEELRAAAIQGDQDILDGKKRSSKHHSCKQTGVVGSSVFWKLSYLQHTSQRGPDNMHCAGNEAKQIVKDMVCDVAGVWTGKKAEALLEHEQRTNER